MVPQPTVRLLGRGTTRRREAYPRKQGDIVVFKIRPRLAMPLVVSPNCLNLLFQGGKSGLGSVKDQGILALFTRICGPQVGLDEYLVVGIKQK